METKLRDISKYGKEYHGSRCDADEQVGRKELQTHVHI